MKCRGALLALLIVPLCAWLPHGASSPPPSGALTLLTLEDGILGQSTTVTGFTAFPVGGYGRYTGTAPSTATGAWTGCGGGAASNVVITPNIMGSGTYLVQADAPGSTGNCTLTITTNLGTVATSPTIAMTNWSTGSEIVSNVHNAPGWLTSHSYSPASGPKTRVVNGAAWAPGSGLWTPGAALNAYELISGGSCTSAASGGPSGTGSSIADGTCTWKYLSGVDYISASGWNFDGPIWVSGSTYVFQQVTTRNDGGVLHAYMLWSYTGVGDQLNIFCTSTVPPSGTTAQFTTADGCIWRYLVDVKYSSQVSYVPTRTFVGTASYPASNTHLTRDYKVLLWNDREYVAGVNGETSPIMSMGHNRGSVAAEGGQDQCVTNSCHTITWSAAIGESFRDTLTTSTPLTGYDATKGVALRNADSGPMLFAPEATGLWFSDAWSKINGLQIKSEQAGALIAMNNTKITNNILDGGFNNASSNFTTGSCVWMDIFNAFVNNLVISHGATGIMFKYGNTFILYNTIVNVGAAPANATALELGWDWVFQPAVIANNAIHGFPHAGAYLLSDIPHNFDASSSNNVTTTSGPDTGDAPWENLPTAATVQTIPGTTYGASGAAMFVNPGSDYRPGTALVGAGASYGNISWNCAVSDPGCTPEILNYDTPDILGNPRPNGSSSWTTGAEQHP